jgi:hypothetical protein
MESSDVSTGRVMSIQQLHAGGESGHVLDGPFPATRQVERFPATATRTFRDQ